MQLQAIRTRKITTEDGDFLAILDHALIDFADGEILAVSSKVVALCEGRTVPADTADKAELVRAESSHYLPAAVSRYGVHLTIKANALMPWAGIDESNGDGRLILWPRNPQQSANELRAYLLRRFGLQRAGVIITDSRPLPLRWGVTGFAIAHSGFLALRDYRGSADLFGRPLQMTQSNVADALAAAAVLVMGEGDEQTPMARIMPGSAVEFQDRDPSPEELAALVTNLDDDLYGPLLRGVAWVTGDSS